MQLGRAILLPALAVTAAAGPVPAAADFSLPRLKQPSMCKGADGYAAAFGGRRTFLLDPAEMTEIRLMRDSKPAVRAAYAFLIVRADAALARKPGSVLDKTTIPLSKDRHDYISLAPYWWPDPANPGGPYVRRDGEVNPRRDTRAFDRAALGRFVSDSETLALAYFYSDDARYATKAALLIRSWFIDPATRMNPNMNYAQAIPGRETGRAEGVLDTSGFMKVVDAAGLIGPSRALTDDEMRELERWFARYVDWMQTSANGRDERAARNNHGLWYDAQLIHFALFARRPDIAAKVLAGFPKTRIAVQFAPTGALPAELTRTRGFHYSLYALDAAYDVAALGRCLGVDLWSYTDSRGRGLRLATDYLAAYRARREAWPYRELEWPGAELDALLTRADAAWGPGRYPRATGGSIALRYRPAAR